ncbi:sialidase family protein [Mycoplasma struthionis]|uniref:exo-alpha-sialidase n=1 Tax=Mycoplasma struthionis TaxID=538220 RepID=A0A502M2C9_9MOLU|nr:sialidase family protein [Mycoplasma struthionis]TPI02823.1 hypothetical protein FJM01_00320 [Mycoplasma struthionis]
MSKKILAKLLLAPIAVAPAIVSVACQNKILTLKDFVKNNEKIKKENDKIEVNLGSSNVKPITNEEIKNMDNSEKFSAINTLFNNFDQLLANYKKLMPEEKLTNIDLANKIIKVLSLKNSSFNSKEATDEEINELVEKIQKAVAEFDKSVKDEIQTRWETEKASLNSIKTTLQEPKFAVTLAKFGVPITREFNTEIQNYDQQFLAIKNIDLKNDESISEISNLFKEVVKISEKYQAEIEKYNSESANNWFNTYNKLSKVKDFFNNEELNTLISRSLEVFKNSDQNTQDSISDTFETDADNKIFILSGQTDWSNVVNNFEKDYIDLSIEQIKELDKLKTDLKNLLSNDGSRSEVSELTFKLINKIDELKNAELVPRNQQVFKINNKNSEVNSLVIKPTKVYLDKFYLNTLNNENLRDYITIEDNNIRLFDWKDIKLEIIGSNEAQKKLFVLAYVNYNRNKEYQQIIELNFSNSGSNILSFPSTLTMMASLKENADLSVITDEDLNNLTEFTNKKDSIDKLKQVFEFNDAFGFLKAYPNARFEIKSLSLTNQDTLTADYTINLEIGNGTLQSPRMTIEKTLKGQIRIDMQELKAKKNIDIKFKDQDLLYNNTIKPWKLTDFKQLVDSSKTEGFEKYFTIKKNTVGNSNQTAIDVYSNYDRLLLGDQNITKVKQDININFIVPRYNDFSSKNYDFFAQQVNNNKFLVVAVISDREGHILDKYSLKFNTPRNTKTYSYLEMPESLGTTTFLRGTPKKVDGSNSWRIPGVVEDKDGNILFNIDKRKNNAADLGDIEQGLRVYNKKDEKWSDVKRIVAVSLNDPVDGKNIGQITDGTMLSSIDPNTGREKLFYFFGVYRYNSKIQQRSFFANKNKNGYVNNNKWIRIEKANSRELYIGKPIIVDGLKNWWKVYKVLDATDFSQVNDNSTLEAANVIIDNSYDPVNKVITGAVYTNINPSLFTNFGEEGQNSSKQEIASNRESYSAWSRENKGWAFEIMDWSFIIESDDNGKTWGNMISVNQFSGRTLERYFINGIGSGIQLKHQTGSNANKNGRLIFPIYFKWHSEKVGLIASDDMGKNWYVLYKDINSPDGSESSIIEKEDGTLLWYSRLKPLSFRKSVDGGKTWTFIDRTNTSYQANKDTFAAISYTKTNNNEFIFLSTPRGYRVNGAVYVFEGADPKRISNLNLRDLGGPFSYSTNIITNKHSNYFDLWIFYEFTGKTSSIKLKKIRIFAN